MKDISLKNLEDNLMVFSSNTNISKKTAKIIKNLVNTDLDWNYLIINSCRNWVLSLTYYQINKICSEDIPIYYLTILKDNFDFGVRYNLLLTSELLNILKFLESNNIKAIPHKGPVLSYIAYKNLALRELDELTIIVDEKDVLKIKELFFSQGYVLKYSPMNDKENSFIKSVREYIFINENNKIRINIKWNYLKDFFSSPNDLERIWSFNSKETFDINGFELINPPIEDILLILCIENAKSQWIRLVNICDIAELIRNNKLNWEEIVENSKKFRLQRILWINLYLTNQLFGVKIPNQLFNKIKSDENVKKISNNLITILFNHNDHLIKMRRKNIRDAKLSFHIREKKIDGIIDCFKTLIVSDPYKIYDPAPLSFYDYLIKSLNFLKERFLGDYPKILVQEPYVKTATEIIKEMLHIAEVSSEDILYDLGSGDGSIVITAAKEYGVCGVGIEIDPKRVIESCNNAKKEHVENLTSFIQQDIMKSDFSKATIVTMYHIPTINLAIRSHLQKKLKPNTRVVTRDFTMGEWKPIKTEIISYNGRIVPIYLYKT